MNLQVLYSELSFASLHSESKLHGGRSGFHLTKEFGVLVLPFMTGLAYYIHLNRVVLLGLVLCRKLKVVFNGNFRERNFNFFVNDIKVLNSVLYLNALQQPSLNKTAEGLSLSHRFKVFRKPELQ